MSNSLVYELQRKALDSSIPITDLIRQAYLLSRKLQVPDFEDWIEKEMNGYGESDDLPVYRNLDAEIKAFNPYRGWIPVLFDDHKVAEYLNSVPMRQPIGEIESLANSKESDYILIKFTPETEVSMRKRLKSDMQIARHTSIVEFKKVLDAVRNALLQWTVDLEKDNITGQDMNITTEEKRIAQTVNYNIQNYIGSAIQSPIIQGSTGVSQVSTFSPEDLLELLEEIKVNINDINLRESDKEELESYVETTKSQLKIKKKNNVIIMEALKSIRSILEGVTSSHIATQLGQRIQHFIELIF